VIAQLVQLSYKLMYHVQREIEVGRVMAQADYAIANPDGLGDCGVPADDHDGDCGGLECEEGAWVYAADEDEGLVFDDEDDQD